MSEEFGTVFLYVVTPDGADKPCKVGRASRPEVRVRDLAIGSPVPLALRHVAKIIGPAPKWGSSRPYYPCNNFAARVEAAAHDLLNADHKRGEWFDVHADAAIQAVNRAVNENKYSDK